MAKILSFSVFKKRPLLMTTIVVIGGLLVYFLFFRGGDNPESPQQVGYTDASVNAGSALAMAQMEASARGQELQAQITGLQIQAQSQLAITESNNQLQRELGMLSLKAAQLDQASEMYAIGSQERIQMYGIEANTDLQRFGLETSAHIAELQVSSELESLRIQAERDLMQQSIMTQGQLALSAQAAAVTMAGIQSQENMARYSMDTTLGMHEMSQEATLALSKMAYDTQVALGAQDIERTRINVSGANYQAAQATKQKKSDNKSGLIGGVIGLVGSLFCDRNIKSIGKCVSNESCLEAVKKMPIESWRYLEGSEPHDAGDTATHINTYSQDFYRTLGADDWEDRKRIDIVDYFGALTGAVKALAEKEPA